mmetsp:Transcript_68887/g.199856  ORF Transcript_68887/g.199856 Transcript_68887/m.199856 type:complete len:291 (-) Transcript_68887:331-1203(-)
MVSALYAAEAAMTMKTLAFPTICMAVAPIRWTTEMPQRFNAAAQKQFRANIGNNMGCASTSASAATPKIDCQNATAPKRKPSIGARRPWGSRTASTKSATAPEGVCNKSNCAGESTGSSSTATFRAARAGARPETLRWMTTFFSDRNTIAASDSQMPHHGCSMASFSAASMPPRMERIPPKTTSATASHRCKPKCSPKSTASAPVMAGVMLPNTTLRPGSISPKDMLFATMETVWASTMGSTRRLKKPTKRQLRNGIPDSVSEQPGRARPSNGAIGMHNIANWRKVRKVA